jgi:hypothetical protein
VIQAARVRKELGRKSNEDNTQKGKKKRPDNSSEKQRKALSWTLGILRDSATVLHIDDYSVR